MFFKSFPAYGSRKLLEQTVNDWLGRHSGMFVADAVAGEMRLFLKLRRSGASDRRVPGHVRMRLFKPMSQRDDPELMLNQWAQHDCRHMHAWCANDHFVFVFYEPKEHA